MLEIPEISDIDAAFPVKVPLPKWEDLPKEFRRDWHNGRNKFTEIASTIFYKGGRLSDFGLTPKDGVDILKAQRAIMACLRSFEPKHEHKIAGVGYMLSEWFDVA